MYQVKKLNNAFVVLPSASVIVWPFENIHKVFSSDGILFTALKKIDFTIYQGEFIGLSGKSGSGKTSLLNIAGLIDPPTSGNLFVKNININEMHDKVLSDIRAKEIGFAKLSKKSHRSSFFDQSRFFGSFQKISFVIVRI